MDGKMEETSELGETDSNTKGKRACPERRKSRSAHCHRHYGRKDFSSTQSWMAHRKAKETGLEVTKRLSI